MTTIACNLHGMAYDTQMDDSGIKANIKKVYRVNGDLIGFAGEVSEGLKFIKWYFEHDPNDPEDFDMENTSALVLTKDGKIRTYECHLPIEITDPHYAIGSGALAALSAMDDGDDPQVAIKKASRRDSGTGPNVIWVPIDE